MSIFNKIGNRIFSRSFDTSHPDALPVDVLKKYYQSRHISHPTYLCHAPFNNMYFNSLGDVANCWLTFDNPEHYSESTSIKEIWFGEKFSKLRNDIKAYNLSSRCATCKHNIESGNYVNSLSKAYDNEFPLGEYPSMMEFELSNACNLECTMCTGLLSSSIRRNREKLEPLISPYGDKFVDELREFIPHLHEARFNGGEPFLVKQYFKIWDIILELNPKLKIVIATNGSVLNARVKDYLLKGNFHINISIDSLTKEIYESIRINGNFDRLMEHFQFYAAFCKENKRNICVMINPMRQNWWEMPDFVNFCNKHQVHLWFNTIHRPYDQALWTLPSVELKKIYEKLSSYTFEHAATAITRYNIQTFQNLVHQQIHTWMLEAIERENAQVTLNASIAVDPLVDLPKKLEAWAVQHYGNDLEGKDECLRALHAKLETLCALSADLISKEEYYTLMLQGPVHLLAEILITESPELLMQRLKHHLQTQTPR